jgi:tetratricopeptide (TPR) repeat protein
MTPSAAARPDAARSDPPGESPPASQHVPMSWKTRDRRAASRARTEPTAEEAAKLAELHAALEALSQQDDCSALGIAAGSSAETAAAAFREQTKRYHPDLFARYANPEIRQAATEIFVLLRQASVRIGDAERRRTSQPAAVEPKGEPIAAHPEGGRRSDAPPMTTEERFSEAFVHAAHHRDREAELALLVALEDQPDNAAGRLCLFTVQARQAKAGGALDQAAARYEQALELDPHNVEATHELRSLPGAWRRAKTALGRLWKKGGGGG